ncbi:MAG: hypothetical protein ABSG73_11100 [Candidatus Aminicenantales bacterium]|jgi:hypothetical protein
MPNVKIKYELRVPNGLSVEELVFEHTQVDLAKDKDPADPNLFKSLEAYSAYPSDDQLRIKLLANGQEGFAWTLKVWANDKSITDTPIEISCNSMGKADYDDKIRWK